MGGGELHADATSTKMSEPRTSRRRIKAVVGQFDVTFFMSSLHV